MREHKPYYRVTVDKTGIWPFRWSYIVHALDGSSMMGMWGSAWTEQRAYDKAAKRVERYRNRISKMAEPKTIY